MDEPSIPLRKSTEVTSPGHLRVIVLRPLLDIIVMQSFEFLGGDVFPVPRKLWGVDNFFSVASVARLPARRKFSAF